MTFFQSRIWLKENGVRFMNIFPPSVEKYCNGDMLFWNFVFVETLLNTMKNEILRNEVKSRNHCLTGGNFCGSPDSQKTPDFNNKGIILYIPLLSSSSFHQASSFYDLTDNSRKRE